MRFLSAFLLPLLLAASLHAAPFHIVRVWPGHRTAESFDRISEFLTGEENPGRQTILRTQPTDRAGYYFLMRIDNPDAAITGATVQLDVIRPDSSTPKNFLFTTTVPHGSHAFNIGLSGTDWPGTQVNPVAWRLIVRSADGTELARQQSFLWALPEKK
jgi:hypothetical protein